jgi:hypothetical protein
MSAGPRSRPRRRRDTEHRLTRDVDLWVASASADGAPYLVPLSFDWDGEALLVATPTDSPTGRNLAATRAARLGLGHTRDVSMIDGEEQMETDGDSMSMTTRKDTQSPALHVADSHGLIRVQGARVNNLKDVSVEIPKRRLTAFTGVSGSARARWCSARSPRSRSG